jgi:hypothetical protein
LALDGDIIVERLHPEKPAVLLIILNMPRKHAWTRGEEKDRLRAAYAEPLKRLANSPYPAPARSMIPVSGGGPSRRGVLQSAAGPVASNGKAARPNPSDEYDFHRKTLWQVQQFCRYTKRSTKLLKSLPEKNSKEELRTRFRMDGN